MKSFYKICVLVFISSILLVPAFPLQDAFAITTIVWRLSGGTVTSAPLNQGDVFGTDYVTVRVDDSDLDTNGSPGETINVQLTSTTGDSFTLTLTETADTGIFDSGNIVLMSGVDRFSTTDTGTVSIEDSDCDGGCNVNAPDVLTGVAFTQGSDIFSDTDSATGITLTLVETGDDTRIFTGSFDFTTSGGSSGSTLSVSPGDVITYFDNEDGEFNNGYILGGPANEGAISAVSPSIGTIVGSTHFVTAAYNGITADLEITDDFAGGRGSGGLIRPGLVVDSVAPSPSSTNTESSSGSGCSGDCTPPTVGIDSNLKRIVENGFSFNDNPVNAELYYTPYPLITVNVGQQNKVELKIFDNEGFDNIAHVGLGFGLGEGESFDKSRATINLDMTRDGQNILSKFDPENVLENVAIITDRVQCNSTSSVQCLKVMIFHTFRAPLEFNMLATYIWDHSKNAWQNYYNHGIHIEGDSLNPPKEYSGIHKGHLIHLFETGKNTAIDSDGNTWTFDKTWKMDYVALKKRIDGITQHGIDRHNAWFESYKHGQELLAKEKLNLIMDGKEIENNSNYLPKTHYGDFYNTLENIQLQSDIKFQKLKAKYIFSQLYDVGYNFEK